MTELLSNYLPKFVEDASRYLTEMRGNLQSLNDSKTGAHDCDKLLHRIFQNLHTLKGSASIFELNAISNQAHELETVVCAVESGEISFDQTTAEILSDGFDALENLLQTASGGGSAVKQTANSILSIKSNREPAKMSRKLVGGVLSVQIFAQLNESERARLTAAAKKSWTIFVLEVSFDFARFAQESDRLRRALLDRAEIIATLPGNDQIETKLVLRFVAAAALSESELSAIANDFAGKIIFSSNAVNNSSFSNLCEMAFAAGRQTAARSGKTVEFINSTNELIISGKHSEAVSTALLHLIRNAVAHGVETPAERAAHNKSPTGKITVAAEQTAGSLQIVVSDDGRGINSEKLQTKIANDPKLSVLFSRAINPNDLLTIIFQPGFSTSETIDVDAGRGIGLDAVAAAIEKVGGSITVQSEITRGTVFTIVLPANQSIFA